MSKTLSWEEFVNRCKSCTACPLHLTRQNVVIYRGSVKAPLMILGEGPGQNEDETGIPFVGRAGRLLDLLLNSCGLQEDIFHICNIVKCRPPNNATPSKEEALACRPLLTAQFKFIQPSVILLLGASAYKGFTGLETGITRARGQWIEQAGYYVMPTLHPAYILRNNKARKDLWSDIYQVRKKLEELDLIKGLDYEPIMPEGWG